MPDYDQKFFAKVRDGAGQSARALVPLVLDLVHPRSVIDVGCGDGTWLSVFQAQGVAHILGVDGAYVNRADLAIAPEFFQPHDLTRPLPLAEKFDLVVSLEVAEHLPATSAETFVQSLTRLGPVILFSAAIPHQRGTHHINEQWPDYWIARFAAEGYEAIDCVRPQLWDHDAVEWWYAQNTFLFVQRAHLTQRPALQQAREKFSGWPVRLVHPRAYQAWIDEAAWVREANRRMFRLAQDLTALVPAGATFVLVDDTQFEPWAVPPGRHMLPFLERDGQFWGAPGDDATAIAELERMRAAGATHLVVGWLAFWWLGHYREFFAHVRQHFPGVHDDENAVVFDLRDPEARP